jgi:Flp pilus assembly protein TadG
MFVVSVGAVVQTRASFPNFCNWIGSANGGTGSQGCWCNTRDSVMRQTQSKPNRRGTACVEFAVVLPILLIFILGILEMGRYVEVYQLLEAAAREGACQASTGQMTDAQVIAAVTGCVQAAGLPTSNLTVTVNDLTNPGTDVSQATMLDNLQVTVTLPHSAVAWSPTSYYTNSSTQISTTVYWVSANPQSYPSSVTAPTGS